jgi:protein SCO1
MQLLLFILAMCAILPSASAAPPQDPAAIAYVQRPGARLPMETRLRDQNDALLRVSELFEGKPLILAFGYFRCKSFCPVLRADLLETLRRSDLEAGRDYSLAFVSIDPSETPSDAREAKEADIMRWPAPGAENWRFLTGDAASLRALAESVGFRMRVDEKSARIVHPIGVVFVTKDGRVSNYLTGVGYDPIGMRGALARAAAGAVAGKQSLINLLCYEYDASTGGYTFAVTRLLRGGAILTMALLGAMIFRAIRRQVPHA